MSRKTKFKNVPENTTVAELAMRKFSVKNRFPRPSVALKRMNQNRRNLHVYFKNKSLKLCKYAPKGEEPVGKECTNCIESKCVVLYGTPTSADMNHCYYPADHEEDMKARRKKETQIKDPDAGKTGMQIINEFLAEQLGPRRKRR